MTNNLITRTDAQALVPEEVSSAMITNLKNTSAALQLFRRIPVQTNQERFPVLTALPMAYWLSSDTSMKKTTKAAWDNVYMNVAELAVIVPIPNAVAADSKTDLWGTLRPLMEDSAGMAIDAAAFFGTNKPSAWDVDDIATAAAAAGNTYTRGTNNAAAGGIAEDINQLMSLVEDDGYDVSAFVTKRGYRGRLRSARDTTGQKLMDVSTGEIEGAPVVYSMPGLWPSATGSAEMFAGDFSQGLLGIRQDMTFEMFKEGVIQDPATGEIMFNLMQQDMQAMRLVMRVGFVVANPINYEEDTEADRYPFAALLKP